jgi:Circularly permutated YpsA SLOG family
VIDSDGTIILFHQLLTAGTLPTRNCCERMKKPFVVVDGKQISESRVADVTLRFVEEHEIQLLNVAGPRASGACKTGMFCTQPPGNGFTPAQNMILRSRPAASVMSRR